MLSSLILGVLLGLLANGAVRRVPNWLLRHYGESGAVDVPAYGLRDSVVVGLVMIMTVAAYALHGLTITFLALAGLLATLTALAWIDRDTHLLPDVLTMPLLWAGLTVNSLSLFVPPAAAIQGAALGYCSLWGLAKVHQAVTGQLGMEYGDFKLAAALGAWLGLAALYPLIVIAVALGLVFVMLRAIMLRTFRTPFAFGPCLASAGAVYALLPPHWRFW